MLRLNFFALVPLLMFAACSTPERTGSAAPVPIRTVVKAEQGEGSCPKPTYPASARLAGQSGQTVIAFFVNVDGAVTDALVVKSSGSEALDEQARLAVLACKGAKPATVNGVPIGAWGRVTYEWRLE
jgi:protein TonB